jgi:acyl carrier protein
MSGITAEEFRSHLYARVAALADMPIEQVGPDTTLESAGLDSSDAVVLAMEMEEFLGKEIDVGIFLRFKTLAEATQELLRSTRLAEAE